jgi:hypothetical protein
MEVEHFSKGITALGGELAKCKLKEKQERLKEMNLIVKNL